MCNLVPRAHPLDTERGGNSPEDEAAVSGKRLVMDNGMISPGCLENLMKRLEQILNTSDEIMTNSCAAVVSHISSILRSAERLNKKREINTQIGYRNEMSPVSTCKAFTV